MKNRLLLALILGAATIGLHAQSKSEYTILSNLTSKLTNADFTADAPISGVSEVCTYDYNMTAVEVGTADVTKGLFGMQAVTGWTASSPSDNVRVMEGEKSTARTDGANAKAGGIFAYVDDTSEDMTGIVGLGGSYNPPYLGEEVGTQGLGIVAVWGAAASYTQDVTLPAGAYMLVVKYNNTSGGGEVNPNYNGFIADNGTQYLSTLTTFLPGTWQEDVIPFLLKEETSGKISLGYKSGNYGSGSAAHLFIDKVELYSIDPTPLQAAEIAAAKEELLALIEKGENLGADVAASRAVYNNDSATLEQVQAAIESQKELNESATTDLSAYFIKNAHFSQGDALPEDEGITTYARDMNATGTNGRTVHYYGMLPITGWEASNPRDETLEPGVTGDNTNDARACGVFNVGSNSFLGGAAFLPPTTLSDGSTEGKVLGFVGVWTAQSQYKQSVTLPAGKYTLRISYYNAGGTTAFSKNLMGFVEDSGTEHLATTTQFSTLNKWLQEDITFELTESTPGYFTMGYTAANVGSAGMPHFFIDGFQIFYVGDTPIDPSLMGLQAAVEGGQLSLESGFNAELKEQFRAVVEAGAALVEAKSADKDANQAAYDAITALSGDVAASIAAYKKLEQFNDETLEEGIATYDEDTYADLNQTLLDLQDEVSEALQEYTWDNDKINEVIAGYDSLVIKGVKTAWDAAVESGEPLAKDLDISILFDQLAYTYSTTALSNTNVPDKEWQYGDASNFKTQYGTAEVWNQSPFTVSRTLKDLPAGTYTITTKAFYRYSDQATNYDSYTTDPDAIPGAFVFAGYSKTKLNNIAIIASDNAEAFASTSAVGDGLFVPNSQQAAHDVFENDDYTDNVQKSVATVLADTGDLTFGISADGLEANSWVVWYTFSVKYNAIDQNVLFDELSSLITEVNDYLTENEDAMNKKASTDAGEAAVAATAALAGDNEAMSEALASLQAAYEEAQKNVANMAALEEAKDELSTTADDYLSQANSDAEDAYNEISDKLDDENYIDALDNAGIEALIEEVKSVTAALKIPAYEDAADDNPIDFTQVIVNPSFETGDLTGWTNSGTVNAQTQNNNEEVANKQGTYYCERWHVNGTVDINQTVDNLPAGTYELTATAYSVAEDAVLYVNDAAVSISTTDVYSVIFQLAEPGAIKFGVRWSDTGSLWTTLDNFQLTYYGTDSEKELTPTDIAGIEAAEAAPAAIYTLTGVKVATLQKGLNIVVDQNGNAKKVYVK